MVSGTPVWLVGKNESGNSYNALALMVVTTRSHHRRAVTTADEALRDSRETHSCLLRCGSPRRCLSIWILVIIAVLFDSNGLAQNNSMDCVSR